MTDHPQVDLRHRVPHEEALVAAQPAELEGNVAQTGHRAWVGVAQTTGMQGESERGRQAGWVVEVAGQLQHAHDLLVGLDDAPTIQSACARDWRRHTVEES